MSEDIRLYYWKKWRKAETGVGKMEVLYDFIVGDFQAEEWFEDLVYIEELELMDMYELEDFYEEYQELLEEKWWKLVYEYEDEEEED